MPNKITKMKPKEPAAWFIRPVGAVNVTSLESACKTARELSELPCYGYRTEVVDDLDYSRVFAVFEHGKEVK